MPRSMWDIAVRIGRWRTVGLSVVGDELAGVFLGRLVISESGVAGRGVEDPLGVVEHEVVFWVFRPSQLLQQPGAVVQAEMNFMAVAEPGLSAGLLKGELDHGVGQARVLLSGPSVIDHVVVAAVCDVTFGEDTSTSRTGSGPPTWPPSPQPSEDVGYLHVPEGRREHTTPAEAL